MIDIDSHVLRIENKVARTNGQVYVYKDGNTFRGTTNYAPGYDRHLIGVYASRLDSYAPGLVEEDIHWAVREMK